MQRFHALCEQLELQQASALVERLAALYPANPVVAEAKGEIKRLIQARDEERKREISEAERMLARGQAASATRLLNNLTLQYPAEESVRALLERARLLEREQKEREAIQAILAQAAGLTGQKQWDEALAAVEQGLRAYPDRPELLEQAGRIRDQMSAEADLAAIEREIARPDLDRAVAMAEAALKRHPGDATVAELLGRARDRRELKDLLENANRRLLMGDIDEAAQIVS